MGCVIDTTVGTAACEGGRTDTKLFHAYNMDLVAIDTLLRDNKKLISCVQVEDRRWGIVWKVNSDLHFVTLTMSGLERTRGGLNYYVWARDMEREVEVLTGESVIAPAIMLPLLQLDLNLGDEGFVTNCYALTAEDHRSMDKVGGLGFT